MTHAEASRRDRKRSGLSPVRLTHLMCLQFSGVGLLDDPSPSDPVEAAHARIRRSSVAGFLPW